MRAPAAGCGGRRGRGATALLGVGVAEAQLRLRAQEVVADDRCGRLPVHSAAEPAASRVAPDSGRRCIPHGPRAAALRPAGPRRR
ncbi:MAG: hypothetical protein MZW92_35065 [Comamonadaceae bacterium]|nr:hypothetical protein [Comamonadaceae bacterium]